MSDPIDRGALMRKFTTFVKAHGDSEPAPTWNDAVSLVGSMPSAQPDFDLSDYSDRLWKAAYERGKAEAEAELVHCKDCKYSRKITDANLITLLSCNYQNAHGMLVENHGYCKWGKRKETEDDND